MCGLLCWPEVGGLGRSVGFVEHLFHVVRQSQQPNFHLDFFFSSQVEPPEALIVLDVAEERFWFCPTTTIQRTAFGRSQALPRLSTEGFQTRIQGDAAWSFSPQTLAGDGTVLTTHRLIHTAGGDIACPGHIFVETKEQ